MLSEFTVEGVRTLLTDSYFAVVEATIEAQHADGHAAVLTEGLLRKRQAILVQYGDNPKDLGANEAARAAKLNELTADLAEFESDARQRSTRCRHSLEVLRVRLEYARAMLRLLEIAHAAQPFPVGIGEPVPASANAVA